MSTHEPESPQTVTVTLDKDRDHDLVEIIEFAVLARRLGEPKYTLSLDSEDSRNFAVDIAIETAVRLARCVRQNTHNCEGIIEEFLGYDPFFNDEDEPETPEEIVRRLGLSIRRWPKRKAKSRPRGKPRRKNPVSPDADQP